MERNLFDTSVLDGIIIGRVDPHIYAFTTETIPNYLKVGDTYRAVQIRLEEWRKHYPGLKPAFEGIAKTQDNRIFRDYSIHWFLENERKRQRLSKGEFPTLYYSNEFFREANVKDVEDAIADICNEANARNGKYQFYDINRLPETYTYERTETYKPRPNQDSAIENFKKAVERKRKKLLMYAVMRFGKSFTSMCCAEIINAKLVVVVSAKADVKEEWKKTVESHVRFEKYQFATSDELKSGSHFISNTLKNEKRLVLFLTLQDLQGEEMKAKHKELFKSKIDLLLVDESHFGARAAEYGRVLKSFNISKKERDDELREEEISIDQLEENIKVLKAKVTMHLSGTPYRILMGDEFSADDIVAFCQFTDIAEAKQKWDEEHLDSDDVKEWDNPYYGFPQMVRFAFNPSQKVLRRIEQLRAQGFSYAFSELFRPVSITKDVSRNTHKQFVHSDEVFDLLAVIDGSNNDENVLGFLDYDKIKKGEMCRHIVFVLPFRASCDAMEQLLSDNKDKFKNLGEYGIVNIAGLDGGKNYPTSGAVKRKIREYENKNKKTITLTVNRMLTGSTVEQWDTMLYLKDTESPQEYDQAIFRLQNQYIKSYIDESTGDEIKFNMKPQTLLVDFDINRVFRMQEQKSQIYNVNTNYCGNSELRSRIQRELEFSPIIVINKHKLRQVIPQEIMDAVREYSSSKSVADEASAIPTDFNLLDNKTLREEIENLPEIDAKKGLEIKPKDGDDDYKLLEPTNSSDDKGAEKKLATRTPEEEDAYQKSIIKKLATYYSLILFYAFLTDSKVTSLEEVISDIEKSKENRRICQNVGLSIELLRLTKKLSNPFMLSKLDYKIQNVNSLINDEKLHPAERVNIAMQKFGRLGDSQIVTPTSVADEMVNLLPEECADMRILDIASKEGEFAAALYRRFGESIKGNVYSLPTSKITYEFTLKVYKLLGMPAENVISTFTSYDLINEDKYKKKLKKMKFDAIVGNPPYQVMDGGAGVSAIPVYHHFVDVAQKVAPQYISMIMPAKWYNGGRGLEQFRKKMLNDKHLKCLCDFIDGHDCFPNVDIAGGVCYFLWDNGYDGLCNFFSCFNGNRKLSERNLSLSEVLIRHQEEVTIISKITSSTSDFLDKLVYSQKPFGLRTYVKPLEKGNISLRYNGGIGKYDKELVPINKELIDKWKIIMSCLTAEHAGESDKNGQKRIFSSMEILEPKTICTETYMLLNVFDNEIDCQSMFKYLKTQFVRALVAAITSTQHMSKANFQFVPLQDFTSHSDIDWTQSVSDIDRQLYKKYNLSDEEIAFIEQMIKPME